jgi:NAD+ kinase
LRIGIYFRKRIDHLIRIAHNIASFVTTNGSEVLVAPEIQDIFPQHPIYRNQDSGQKPDLLLSLGGDGTFLHAAQYALMEDLPIIGINFGFTGFLTNIEKEEIFQSLELILEGKFAIESSSSLKSSIQRNGELVKTYACLNDFVLQKDPIEKILSIEVYLGSQKIASFRGDGIIIATPSGSTAYSLSAGGPVVDPTCKVYVLTPLCSHKLSGRSLIIPEKEKIFINVFTKGDKTRFIRDGTSEFIIKDLDRISIQRHHRSLKMIVLQEKNFYHTLNQKFQWGF